MSTDRKYTDAEIEAAVRKALADQNIDAVPGLIALLALQNPQRAESLRQTILFGLAIATEGKSIRSQTTGSET